MRKKTGNLMYINKEKKMLLNKERKNKQRKKYIEIKNLKRKK